MREGRRGDGGLPGHGAARDRRRGEDDAGGRVGVDAIEVDERHTEDGERAIVHGLLAVRHAVVHGEGVAVEDGLEAHALADARVARVRRAEEHRVPEQRSAARSIDRLVGSVMASEAMAG